jgi:flagellar basal body rod protein FlgG
MNVSMAQAAAALNANERWQELIAENLASNSIPGFRKQELSFSSVQAGLMGPSSISGSNLTVPFLLPKSKSSVNFTPGELNATNTTTDIAIEGEGFFEVEMPDGTMAYTRNGGFRLTAEGELTTKDGYPVMSEKGSIKINMKNSNLMSISSAGEISQGAERKGILKVVDFSDKRLLRPIAGGYWVADHPGIEQITPEKMTVRQGFLESSNASGVMEMSSLMWAMRNFEANQKVIQLADERMSRSIGELGNPS